MAFEHLPPTPPFAARARLWNLAAAGIVILGALSTAVGVAPGWICTASAISAILCLIVGASRRNRLARWVDAHDCQLCLFCGYDLRASPEQGPCPECGAVYAREDVRDVWLIWLRPAGRLIPPPIPEPPHAGRLKRWVWMGIFGLPIGGALAYTLQSDVWIAIGVLGGLVFSIAAMAFKSSRLMSAAARSDYRLCTHCGYSMVGVNEPGKCPECGKFYDHKSARPQWRAWCLERP